jgi:hypothetical protein
MGEVTSLLQGHLPAMLNPALMDTGQLLFPKSVIVVHFTEALLGFRGLGFEQVEAAFGELAEGRDAGKLLFVELGPSMGLDLEEIAAIARQRQPFDQPKLNQQARHGANRPLAGLQHLGEFAAGLVRRLRNQQPAKDASGHAGQPNQLKHQADFFDKMRMLERLFSVQRRLPQTRS